MPGWTPPYNVNMEMRRFADRTIRQETPSHLVGKICWVGNDGFIENPCDPVVNDLVKLLITKGLTSGGVRPGEKEACDCANAIYKAFSLAFKGWYDDKTLSYLQPDVLEAALETEFTAKVKPAEISCAAVLDAALWAEILERMVAYFHHIALYGWQFERFEDAWRKWLDANAAFDWTEERLSERIEAILSNGVLIDPGERPPREEELCNCAASILTNFGMDFYEWMDTNIKAGNSLDKFTAFTPGRVTLCEGLKFKSDTDTASTIEKLLKNRYEEYKEVSYRLWIVVNLLGNLRNIYPGATLHDCDDGSDQNPVRLGQTVLGNYTARMASPPLDTVAEAPQPDPRELPGLESVTEITQPDPPAKKIKKPKITARSKAKPVKPRKPGKTRKSGKPRGRRKHPDNE
jgi:hypothetical protein